MNQRYRQQPSASSTSDRRIYTVGQLNTEVRLLLEQGMPTLWLEGEVSNFSAASSGHWYFSLKDAHAQVPCAMFRTQNRLVQATPQNGDQVRVRARVTLYEAAGRYQLKVDHLEPAGVGRLHQAFEALKQKLDAEGLFAQKLKQSLPTHPKRIGLITSAKGAAVRDILHVLQRRAPALEVIVYPVPVQGEQAAADIIRMLDIVAGRAEVDVVLLTRGGGSLEDLWAFNDERLARKIVAFPLPIVSAVGHEIDFTIADFVADQRAPTPSAGAELVSPDQLELLKQLAQWRRRLLVMDRLLGQRLVRLRGVHRRLLQQHPARRLEQQQQRFDQLQLRLGRLKGRQLREGATRVVIARQRMKSTLQQRLGLLNQRLSGLERRLSSNSPQSLLNARRERLSVHQARLKRASQHLLQYRAQRAAAITGRLENISPLKVLGRGYAIVQKADGDVLRDPKQVSAGEALKLRVQHGELDVVVKKP